MLNKKNFEKNVTIDTFITPKIYEELTTFESIFECECSEVINDSTLHQDMILNLVILYYDVERNRYYLYERSDDMLEDTFPFESVYYLDSLEAATKHILENRSKKLLVTFVNTVYGKEV